MNTEGLYPDPGSGNGWMVELTEAQRVELPAVYHRPHFYGLAEPVAWICEACWGEGWTTAWPCDVATAGGVDLAKSLGVGWSW